MSLASQHAPSDAATAILGSARLTRQPSARPRLTPPASSASAPPAGRLRGEPLASFSEACGGAQTVSLSICRRDSGLAPKIRTFRQQPFVVIGRSLDGDVVLPDRLVNFRHFYLQLVGGRWVFVNLAEISGTLVQEQESPWGWFDPGCELSAGPYTITNVSTPPRLTQSPNLGIQAPRRGPLFELELRQWREQLTSPAARSFHISDSDRQ